MRRLIILVAAASLVLAGAGCAFLQPKQTTLKPVGLEYWRADDGPEVLAEVITAYQKTHPNVAIKVTSFDSGEYREKLLEALAEDRGPDIFSLPNVDLRGWQTKLLPLPDTTAVPFLGVDEKTKQVTVVNRQNRSLTVRELIALFVETVGKDVVMTAPPAKEGEAPKDRIYGLPFSADSLVMFYNKSLLAAASIEKPAATWNDLAGQTGTLTVLGADGAIKQSGAALGWSDNVRYFTDILATIMSQNGAVLTDEGGYSAFHEYPPGVSGGAYPPGVQALMFYKSFISSGAPNYSWNAGMPDSLDAFVEGRTAVYFGFPGDIRQIRDRAPRLDLGVAPMPQVRADQPKNIAHYPVEVVSAKTASGDAAWDFLQFAARQENVAPYLAAAKRPTALRALIGTQLTDPDAGAAVSQVLTARSWYRGRDWSGAEKAFREMIDFEPTYQRPSYLPAVANAADAVDSTMR